MKTLKSIWLVLLCHSLTAQTIDTNFATDGILVVNGFTYLDGTLQNTRFIFENTDEKLNGFTLNGVQDFNFGNGGSIDPFDPIPFVSNFWGYEAGLSSCGQYSIQAQNGNFASTPNENLLIVAFYDTDGQQTDTVMFAGNDFANWEIPNISFTPDESKTYLCLTEVSMPPPAMRDSLYIFSVNQNGTKNTAFGINGKAYINLLQNISGFEGYGEIKNIHLSNDGIYITLQLFQSGNDFNAIIKLNSDGSFDSNFGVKNLNQLTGSTTGFYMAAYSNEAVYVLNYTNKIYKLNLSTFTLDTGFGNNGKIVPTEPNGEYYNIKVLDGKLYGIGRVVINNHYKPLLSRFALNNGTADNAFGVNGSLLFTDPQFLDEYNFTDIIPYTTNSFYVVGDSYLDSGSGQGNYHDMFVVKYNQTPTGISNIEANAIQIYPNPVTEKVFIGSSGIYSAKIISSQGAVVGTIYNATESTLDFSQFAPGLYFIELQTSKGTSSYKIIKQ